MLRVRGLGASLLAVALLITIAGCGSDDEGLPPLPSLTAISPAVSTPPTTPVQPSATTSAAMTEEQAIEAAVRFYYEGFGRAYDTGDADELAKGSTQECSCRRAVEVVREALDLGTVVGGRVEVLSVGEPRIPGDVAGVVVTIDNPDGVLRTPAGREQTVMGQGRVSLSVRLAREEGTWLVDRITDPFS